MAENGTNNGGAGGHGRSTYAHTWIWTDGNGNPRGGTGGLVVIYCGALSGTGEITSAGNQNAVKWNNQFWYGNGATGGGSVNIFIKIGGNISETQKISATGPETYPGSVKKAGDGSVTITYIKDIEI